MNRGDALDLLTRCMYEDLEHMDPTDDRSWDELTERERELYCNVMAKLVDRRSLMLRAMGDRFADDDMIYGRSQRSE